jgi:large subunit ribosomal protein L21
MEYAIMKTGGKQYRVSPGDAVDVEKLSADEGDTVEVGDVLLISRDQSVTVGSPMIEGAKVTAVVEMQGRGHKLVVFKYKSKTRQGTKTGHRQSFTRLRITDIAG